MLIYLPNSGVCNVYVSLSNSLNKSIEYSYIKILSFVPPLNLSISHTRTHPYHETYTHSRTLSLAYGVM
jgi:hypothetical protein